MYRTGKGDGILLVLIAQIRPCSLQKWNIEHPEGIYVLYIKHRES
jgi:hypothetical protein